MTWDPSYFGDSSALVQVQADFTPSSGEDPTPLDDAGFISNSLRAGTGSYSWAISSSILNSSTSDAGGINAQLYFVVSTGDGGSENRTLGPLVRVVPISSSDTGSGSGPNLVAIIVPVVVGALVLMAIAAFFIMKRRKPEWKVGSMFSLGKTPGYGSRKSRSERAVGMEMSGNAVQVGDVGVSKPQEGRNVFREEIRRQEEARS